MSKILAGISTRGWQAGLKPVGEQVDRAAAGTLRRATETALAEPLVCALDDLDLMALMLDGVHICEHVCIVALGIGLDGNKHVLALVEAHREHHGGHRPAGRAVRTRPGSHPSDPGCHRRGRGALLDDQ